MRQLPFIKMHGAENDYIFFDGLSGPLPRNPRRLAPRICNRHAGIGGDGIICMIAPADQSCDVQMQIWNADGSSAEMCGNAARCIAVWMQYTGRISGACRIQTDDRTVTARGIQTEGNHGSATVSMGPPKLLTAAEGQTVELTDATQVVLHCIDMGNPHAVLFVDELTDALVHRVGPSVERHSMFSERTNVEFAVVGDANPLLVRVWERGSGETRACGSGACAVVAAAINSGRIPANQPYHVALPGGTLTVDWQQDSGNMLLSGPVEIACTGTLTEDSQANVDQTRPMTSFTASSLIGRE